MCMCVCVCVCDPIGLCACVFVIYGCVYNVLLECCVRVQKIGKEAVTSTVDSFFRSPLLILQYLLLISVSFHWTSCHFISSITDRKLFL